MMVILRGFQPRRPGWGRTLRWARTWDFTRRGRGKWHNAPSRFHQPWGLGGRQGVKSKMLRNRTSKRIIKKEHPFVRTKGGNFCFRSSQRTSENSRANRTSPGGNEKKKHWNLRGVKEM